jgi:hypothetical protein
MNVCCILAGLLAAMAQAPVQSPAPDAYRQTYQILLRGAPAGSETVSETKDASGNLVSASEHEMLVSDGLETKRVAFVTEMVLASGSRELLRYRMQFLTGESRDSCEVTVHGKQIDRTLIRGSRRSESSTPLKPGMVLLEANVYHLYEFLAGRYDLKKGGRQIFQAYLPPVGADIPATLTWLEDGEADTPRGKIAVRSFKFELAAISGGIFTVDAAGRLVRLVNPGQELEVVRQ